MKTFNVFIAIGLISGSASAADFSFIGNLNQDDAVQEFNFEVEGAAREVTLRIWSYTGGTNAQGQVIPGDGFDPIISLFNSTGTLIGVDNPLLTQNLSAGNYTATITQFNSYPVGSLLSEGFNGTTFEDFGSRTSQWALDVSNVESASVGISYISAVPEPETFTLLLAGLGLLGITARRRKAESRSERL